jgi:hypothetical protein
MFDHDVTRADRHRNRTKRRDPGKLALDPDF